MKVNEYPFVHEFITDSSGEICKVILQFEDYQRLLKALEDEGLHRTMQETVGEESLSLEAALTAIEHED